MDDFVKLDRRFTEFDPELSGESDGLAPSAAYYYLKSWSDVLTNGCTVIVGEAGTGKTQELRHKAIELRQSGQQAFFAA